MDYKILLVICFSITDCLKEHNWLYRTGDSLGSGSYGEVFKVEHKVDGSKYAVKKLEKVGECNAEMTVKEADQMCGLLQENVCRYYNAWQENGVVYIRMELCDKDLPTWIRRRNRLLFGSCGKDEPHDNILRDGWVLSNNCRKDHSVKARRASSSQQTCFKNIKAPGTNDFLKGLLKGLRYLHFKCHLAHQDLHSKNILLKISASRNSVTAKICDFGLASMKTGKSSNAADDFCQDMESVGKIMVRLYYPLDENEETENLLSKLKQTRSHTTQLNSDFGKMWPDQASWIRRLLSDEDDVRPSAAVMLDEGMRSESETFPSEKYRKGLTDGAQPVACYCLP